MESSKDILNRLEVSKCKWIENGSWWMRRKANKEKKAAEEIEKLVEGVLNDLKQLKVISPEKFEEFYWKTYMIVERDNIYNNSCSGIKNQLALAATTVGMFFTALGTLNRGSTAYDEKVVIGVGIMAIGILFLGIIDLHKYYITSKRSYYHFLLKVLEDVRDQKHIETVQAEINTNEKIRMNQ